jgi:hypothetical protein
MELLSMNQNEFYFIIPLKYIYYIFFAHNGLNNIMSKTLIF